MARENDVVGVRSSPQPTLLTTLDTQDTSENNRPASRQRMFTADLEGYKSNKEVLMSVKTNFTAMINHHIISMLIAVILALAIVSCRAKEAEMTKPLSLQISGGNTKALTFSNWAFDHMNGSNPVFAGKITYNGGVLNEINVFCFQGGMKSNAYLFFNTNLQPGESAKGELHCAQITTLPEKIVVELN
ncbi:MAG: hypothetical protein AB1461_07500 [Thermodesulfobacteriota bacterium]